MIDLHSHILPGLDDGPSNIDFSVAMARAAVEAGTQMMVATPHIRSDFNVRVEEIEPRVDELNARLEAEQLPLRVVPGGEVGWASVPDLDAVTLERVALGSGSYVLLESPYGRKPVDVEAAVEVLAERGFRSVLAHPERCPLFERDIERLARMVDGGALCSITAGSMSGRFGATVRRFTIELLRRGLVHDVASDAHDHLHRPPGLMTGFEELEGELPGITAQCPWYTVTAPVAILAGNPLPPMPDRDGPRSSRLSRFLRRGGGARLPSS